jgi:tetratricopeptide (TPR) repeat protein
MDRAYEAIHFITRALKFDKNNPLYWQTLAEAEYKIGNIMSSFDAYQEASQHDPSNPGIWLDWSLIYYEQGEHEKALVIVKAGLDEVPANAEMNYRAAVYLISAAKYKEAFNFLENALILDFDKHALLFDFFPKPETQKALYKIIDQFRK